MKYTKNLVLLILLNLKKSILLLSFYFLLYTSYSQIPEIQWQQCYGTNDPDKAYCIEQTNQGYMVAMYIYDGAGLTNSHGIGEIWVLNIDTIGNIIWDKCFGGSVAEEPRKIVQGPDNYYFLYGYTGSTDGDVQSPHNGESDLWLVKMDSVGEIIWERCYGSPGPEEPKDFILTPDGGGLMLCRTHAVGGDVSEYFGSWDVWLCKVDSIGNIDWEKTVGHEYLNNAVSIILTTDKTIVLLGASVATGGLVECGLNNIDYYDIWLVEMDLNGEILGQHCYGGSHNELAYVAEQLDDGFIIAGHTNSNDGDVSGYHGSPGVSGYKDIWVFRLDTDWNIVWQKCLGGGKNEYSKHISQNEDGSFLLVGDTYSTDYDVSNNHAIVGTYEADIWVVKLSSDGELLWDQCYGGIGNERLYVPQTVLKKSDYNYALAAWTDYVSDDVTCELHQQHDRDAWILELNIDDTTATMEYWADRESLKTYPNPARDYVVFEAQDSRAKIQESRLENQRAEVLIVNVFGKEIASLPLKPDKTVWDTRNIPSGIYFYAIELEGKLYSGKVVVQK